MKEHKISLGTAILMSVNIMVGSGILIGPAFMASKAGNAAFLTWLIVALLFLPIVLTTVKLSKYCPGEGGFYQYAKAGLNEVAGFWGGMIYVAGYTFALAVQVLALREMMYEALGANWEWLTTQPLLFNILAMTAIMGVNYFGMRSLSNILNSLTIFKVIPLVSVILLLPFIISPSFTITVSEIKLLPLAMPMAIFGYFGFEYCCSISHMIENSERNAPLAILGGFTITALLYTLFTFGILNIMGPEELAAQGASVFADYLTLPIPYFKQLMKVLIPASACLTLFATGCGLLHGNSTALSSMARKGLFHGSDMLAQESGVQRPWVAITLLGSLSLLIAIGIPYTLVVGNLCNVGVFTAFILLFLSLIRLQLRDGKTSQVPLSVLALLMVIGLVCYSFMQLGPTIAERVLYLTPLVGFLVLSAFFYKWPTNEPVER